MREKAIVLYIPVIHRGYVALIERHQPADVILITWERLKPIDAVIADQLSRDIRAIPAEEVAAYLHYKFPALRIRAFERLKSLQEFKTLVMPDEDISQALKKKLPDAEIVFDNAFLRWDWGSTMVAKEVVADCVISTDDLDRDFMKIAEIEAQKSSDFWRSVGAVVPIGDTFLAAFNKHLPTPMEIYVHGDMRLIMKPGEQPEICNAIHAERSIFAQALRHGIPLEGKSIYTTTYPCLQCAQMMAEIGFKKMFFREGYSNQNAAEVLRKAGIEIIQVK